jgi:hypothetical protein
MDIFSLLAIGQLWSLSFADGSVLNGTMCTSVFTNASGAVVYRAPSADVEIASRSIKDGVEVKGKVTVRSGVVTDFMLPARMTFSPDDVERVSFSGNKWMGTGYSLKDDFFRPQTDVAKCSWEAVMVKGFVPSKE